MMNSTNFANVQKRLIRMGPRGGFFVAKADGSKKRKPVARFRKGADGSLVRLTKGNLPNVPAAIRPKRAAAAKAAPKPRKRVRTPMAPTNARKARMNAMAMKRAVGIMAAPRRRIRVAPKGKANVMVMSPGGTFYKMKRSLMARTRVANQKKMR
jgi:hypothetical protein